ncbi:cornifelin homolog B-like [Antedon mediterranea]|uniref:cornifelin homolog B-like n=1 Tax=Antedon mediterranea TaxID=105859 RepID=UPI003AF851C8
MDNKVGPLPDETCVGDSSYVQPPPIQQPPLFHQPPPIQQLPPIQQQPIVVTSQPVASTHIVTHVSATNAGTGAWSSGLFDCLKDPVSCFGALCCPCLYRCYIADKLGEFFCLPCCLPSSYLTTLRTMVRTKYNIPGSVITDCCTVCWCACCVLTQLSRHHDFATKNKIVMQMQ